jgi:hypothetical protein
MAYYTELKKEGKKQANKKNREERNKQGEKQTKTGMILLSCHMVEHEDLRGCMNTQSGS